MKSKVLSENNERERFLSAKKIFLLSICGALIGFINGFFGGGGGMICVPLLENVLHLQSKYSHATAIAIILPISIVSATIYMLNGNIQNTPFLTTALGFIVGGILGSILLKYLSTKTLKTVFSLLMLASGMRLLF